ncbi:MAG: nickel pincer cofactor biosynthesis protein LarB [Phycisphaerae bacterium]|nr:nickel pincer cofactor biosynthesis protein LarB [Phycisphaerae bacterium]
MNLEAIYNKIKNGEMSLAQTQKELSLSFLEDAGRNIVDVRRTMRTGIPEIVYGEHKTFQQIIEITDRILEHNPLAIISRCKEPQKIQSHYSPAQEVHTQDHTVVIGELPKTNGSVLVLSGGASDHIIASEVSMTLSALGVKPLVFEDRGIAHPTRVLDAIKTGIQEDVSAVIVIAGMEAALASFVCSLVALPVIGVPASIGYGYKAKESALISMLSACTPNLAVVNIDGGVRAAVIAALIAKR